MKLKNYELQVANGERQKAFLTQSHKEHKEMISELKVGDEIATSGGIYGKVLKVGKSYIKLKISENVDIKIQKTSIGKILPKNSLESIK